MSPTPSLQTGLSTGTTAPQRYSAAIVTRGLNMRSTICTSPPSETRRWPLCQLSGCRSCLLQSDMQLAPVDHWSLWMGRCSRIVGRRLLLSTRTLTEEEVVLDVCLGSEHHRYVAKNVQRAETIAHARFRVRGERRGSCNTAPAELAQLSGLACTPSSQRKHRRQPGSTVSHF